MHELLTPAEMAEADRLTISAGTPGSVLMERAGRAVADAVRRHRASGEVVVVAGPGNNGGDGFVAARLLKEHGFRPRVMLAGDQAKLRGDAAGAAASWDGPTISADPAGIAGAPMIIDALFGAGLARPVEGLHADMIRAMNASGAHIIAVDLPSGLDGATGRSLGVAVQASETVTFFRRKPGHLLMPGRELCGPVTVSDIGTSASVLATINPRTIANAPDLWREALPRFSREAHKYQRGHAVVVSGGLAHTGAARLAARAALRAGAGLVTIASPREALAVNAAASLAVMVRPVDGAPELADLLADRRFNAVVLGPGGGVGPQMREQVLTVLTGGERGVVLDADALTSFTGEARLLADAIRACSCNVVLTPHDGEFARLFSAEPEVLESASKLDRARAAASLLGAVILLKGPDTVIAAPDGRAAINENAPPWLATAGSGDVLAGMIAGMLAQGMPPFEAASAAAWMHGEAANLFGPGLISEDLPEQLPAVLRGLTMATAPEHPSRPR
jgi:hydroxyethylthiazole kinase-like uncharacterized protein yjeF